MTWKIDNEGVSYQLDDKHILFVKKTKGGLKIKTYQIEENGKHIILFSKYIGDVNLGFLIPPNKI